MMSEEWQFIHKPLLPVQDVGEGLSTCWWLSLKKGSSAVHHGCENKLPHSEQMVESTEYTTFTSF